METGKVLWITGLSAAGKTTVAHLLRDRLAAGGLNPVLLDGDAMRAILGPDLIGGHARQDRLALAQLYGRLCAELSRQGHFIICATISLFHAVQDWNRENIPGYCEIYLRVPMDMLQRRDPKGIYARAAAGEARDVAGLDFAIEEPLRPDLLIDNHGPINATAAADLIWAQFLNERA